VRSGPGEKRPRNKKRKKKYNDQRKKEMDCDELHVVLNEAE
jgi:hypothetical protein